MQHHHQWAPNIFNSKIKARVLLVPQPMLFLHNPVSSPVRFSGPEMSHIYVCVQYARQIRAAGSGSMNEQLSTYPKAQPLYACLPSTLKLSEGRNSTFHVWFGRLETFPLHLLLSPHLPSKATIQKSLLQWFRSSAGQLVSNSTYSLALKSCPAMKQLIKCTPMWVWLLGKKLQTTWVSPKRLRSIRH